MPTAGNSYCANGGALVWPGALRTHLWEVYLNTPEDPAVSSNRVSHFFFSSLFLFFNHLGLNSQPSYCFSKPINKCFCGSSDSEAWGQKLVKSETRQHLRQWFANTKSAYFFPLSLHTTASTTSFSGEKES